MKFDRTFLTYHGTTKVRPYLFHRFFENQPSQILAKNYSKSILFHGIVANFVSTSLGYSIRKLSKVLPVFMKVDFQKICGTSTTLY